jgi:hypothetical protein
MDAAQQQSSNQRTNKIQFNMSRGVALGSNPATSITTIPWSGHVSKRTTSNLRAIEVGIDKATCTTITWSNFAPKMNTINLRAIELGINEAMCTNIMWSSFVLKRTTTNLRAIKVGSNIIKARGIKAGNTIGMEAGTTRGLQAGLADKTAIKHSITIVRETRATRGRRKAGLPSLASFQKVMQKKCANEVEQATVHINWHRRQLFWLSTGFTHKHV